jgi:hypothetical protein
MLFVVGTGGPGLPHGEGVEDVERCRVVAGWPSVLKRLPLGGKEAVPLSYRNQEETLKRLAALSRKADVCLAVHGDPAVSDRELMERVRALGGALQGGERRVFRQRGPGEARPRPRPGGGFSTRQEASAPAAG